MSQLLARILRFKVTLAFNGWLMAVKAMKDAEKVAEARAAASRRVIGRLLSSAKNKALLQWKLACKVYKMEDNTHTERERLAKEMSLQVAESRLLQAHGQVRRVVKSVMLSRLRCGWRTWRDHELAIDRARQEEARRNSKLAVATKVFARLSLASLTATWNTWMVEVQQHHKETKAMSQLLARILRFKVTLAFNCWLMAVKAIKVAEKTAEARAAASRRVIGRLLSSAKTKALLQWKVACKLFKMEDKAHAERERLANQMSLQVAESRLLQARGQVRRVIKSVMLSKLQCGWRTWRNYELAIDRARHENDHRTLKLAVLVATKAFARLALAALTVAWNTWMVEVQRQHKEEETTSQLMARMLRFRVACRLAKLISRVNSKHAKQQGLIRDIYEAGAAAKTRAVRL